MPVELASVRTDRTWERNDVAVALSVRAARREYANGKGLHGVDLDIAPGELLVLLGPNGAGKTSLVRAICGRLRLSSGSIRIEGRDPTSDRNARRRLGIVPQGLAVYEDLTARENLELFGRLAGVPPAELETAVDDALDWAGLSARSASMVRTLSGGMKRRLNLVAGTLHNPSVLLLDEPTVGVDPEARERLHELLLDLKQRHIAILLTTHDLEQASALADRVAVMAGGRVRAEGSVDSLVTGVFGSARELALRLADAPSSERRGVLSALGFEERRDPRTWTMTLRGSIDSLGQLEARLARNGVELVEMRVLEPSLRGAYFHILDGEASE